MPSVRPVVARTGSSKHDNILTGGRLLETNYDYKDGQILFLVRSPISVQPPSFLAPPPIARATKLPKMSDANMGGHAVLNRMVDADGVWGGAVQRGPV